MPAPSSRAATLAAVALLALSPAAGAQVGEPVEIGDLALDTLLDPVLAAASLAPQRSSLAPASVFVLSAADLRNHGYATLAEALRSVPGLFTYGDGFYEYVGVRGTGLLLDFTTRLLVLVDGHPLNNTLGVAEAHLGPDFLVPLAAVERVEVVKGPVGGVYGPTAFLAVVNVVTRAGGPGEAELGLTGRGAQGRVIAGELSASVRERIGSLEVAAAAELRGGRGYTWTFPALASSSDRPPVPGGRVAGADGSDAQKGIVRVTAHGVTLAGGCGRWFRQLPSAPYSTLVGDRRNAEESLDCYAALSGERRLGAETVLSGRISWDTFTYRDLLAYAEPPEDVGPFRDRGRDSWLGLDVLVDWKRPGRGRLAAGVSAEAHDTVQEAYSERYPPLSADPLGGLGVGPIRKAYGTGHLHLVGEWELSRGLVLHGGLTGTWHELFGQRLTPKLAVVWSAGPHAAKAIYAEGFRPPTAAEAFFNDVIDFIPNPALRPERARSTELVYERRQGPLTLSLAFFHSWYDRLITITTVPAPGLVGPPDPANPEDYRQQYVNAGASTVTGLETWAGVRLPDLLDATLGLSAQRATRESPNAPRLSANLALATRALWRPLTLAIRGAYLSTRRKDSAAPAPGEGARVGPVLRLDASARLAVPRLPGLELEAGVANLLDGRILHPVAGDFSPLTEIAEAPRTFRLGLRKRF